MSTSSNVVSCHCIPDVIIEEILLRLPVKSIIRFRCVCKTWREISRSHPFVDAHHASSEKHVLVKHLIRYGIEGEEGWEVKKKTFLKLYKDYTSFSMGEPSLPPMHEIELASLHKDKLLIVGSCKGIVCATDYWVIILLNPSLRERKVFPAYHYDYGGIPRLLGFGYDEVNKAFKLVRLEGMDINDTEVEHIPSVYNLSTNSCKRLDHIPVKYTDVFTHCSIVLSGFIHWCVDDVCILRFNMTTDLFQKIPFPQGSCFSEHDYVIHTVSKWKQHLALVSFKKYSGCAIIWIMKEYWVEESWTKLYYINSTSYEIIKPLCIWSGDPFLFESGCGRIISYDLTNYVSTSEIIRIQFRRYSHRHKTLEIVGYRGSLISLSDM